MYWIELHNDPEMLKLGFGMALYGEPKPEKRNYYVIPNDAIDSVNYFSETIYETDLEKWTEQSFIAYLKEAEFKVGNMVYTEFDERFFVGVVVHYSYFKFNS